MREENSYVTLYVYALMELGFGDIEEALQSLERAYD